MHYRVVGPTEDVLRTIQSNRSRGDGTTKENTKR